MTALPLWFTAGCGNKLTGSDGNPAAYPGSPVWYVAAGGKNSNSGTDPAAPLPSVSAALANIRAVYRGGTWPAGESAVIVISGTIDASGPFGPNSAMVDVSGTGNYPPVILKGDPVKGGVLNAGRSPGSNGRVLYIANNKVTLGDKLTLTGGRMLYGGAVCVGTPGSPSAGEFVMTGGEISGNAGGSGGGVMVYMGSMTMTGGTIQNNSNDFNHNGGDGGGVYLNELTAFTMSGGIIKNNGGAATKNGGGVLTDGRARFVMTGGEILGNTSTDYGGGVRVSPYGDFTLSHGTISGNKTGKDGGGGVSVSSSFFAVFTRNGGTVGGNTPNDIKL